MNHQYKYKANGPSKNRVIGFGILISLVIISYQNCGKVQQNAKVTEIPNSAISLSESSDVRLLKNENDQMGPTIFKVNLQNNTVEKRYYEVPAGSPDDVLLATYCLNAEWAQRLAELFAQSSACEYQVEALPGAACTMIYTYPHSIVAVDSHHLKLGEKTSGCSSYLEICSDQRENFRYLTQTLLNEIETQTCAE